MLAVALVAPQPVAVTLLALQAAIFAVSAFGGLQYSPYSLFFRRVVRPRLSPPGDLEDSRPPTFAQVVGLAFLLVALAAYAAGAPTLGLVATAFALVAAVLNAAVGLCLGCELYLAGRRLGLGGSATT
ncbi:MAG: DUF4395 domain-containing protein [Actinomycetales bacterium]|nr:MAG: DUF4395 domain-containing protein [Actinomycetales bacterium]